MKEKLMTVEELAGVMRVHPMTIYRKSREGSIPGCVRFGATIRFRESAIQRWIRENECGGVTRSTGELAR